MNFSVLVTTDLLTRSYFPRGRAGTNNTVTWLQTYIIAGVEEHASTFRGCLLQSLYHYVDKLPMLLHHKSNMCCLYDVKTLQGLELRSFHLLRIYFAILWYLRQFPKTKKEDHLGRSQHTSVLSIPASRENRLNLKQIPKFVKNWDLRLALAFFKQSMRYLGFSILFWEDN